MTVVSSRIDKVHCTTHVAAHLKDCYIQGGPQK